MFWHFEPEWQPVRKRTADTMATGSTGFTGALRERGERSVEAVRQPQVEGPAQIVVGPGVRVGREPVVDDRGRAVEHVVHTGEQGALPRGAGVEPVAHVQVERGVA